MRAHPKTIKILWHPDPFAPLFVTPAEAGVQSYALQATSMSAPALAPGHTPPA
jgi:hypothetical protein